MRVVVLTTSFPRSPDDPSGHFVLAHANALSRDGADVHVVAPGGTAFEEPRRIGSCTLHPAGGGALFGWPGAAARARENPIRLLAGAAFAAGANARLVALAPYDRMVAHWIVPSAFPLALWASRRRSADVLGGSPALEVVAHGADVRLLVAAPRVLRAHVVRALLDRGATFSFAARRLRASLIEALPDELARRLDRASTTTAPQLDVPRVADAARALRSTLLGRRAGSEPALRRLVVAAGRLVATKRVHLAIDAVSEVDDALLVVLGEGPARPELQARAERSRARARIAFLGMRSRTDALTHVAAADALVHPSAVEAAPTVIREARSLGVPVVACDAGDVAAWASTDAGIVMVEASSASIAVALRALEPRA